MRYIVGRLLWMVPTLFGISLIAFLTLELAPMDRATVELQRLDQIHQQDAAARAIALHALEVKHGLVDPETGERRSVWTRYGLWLERTARLEFHGPGDDPKEFRRRLREALPVTMLINLLAAALALGVAAWLGPLMGLRPGAPADRVGSGLLFALYGIPDFVIATLLLVFLSGSGLFPARGLHSDAAETWGLLARMADVGWHLVLPVVTLAIGPIVVITRFVRQGVIEAAQKDFVLNLRAWGAEPAAVRAATRRAGWAPVVTLIGALVPMLVGGSVVVETVFGIPGMGQLAWQALMLRDQGMIMTLTVLSAVLTLLGLLVSDLLHRALDARVRLDR